MAIYVVTGKLGGGKTLACVDRINEALAAGCRVATNLDLELHLLPYVSKFSRDVSVLRVPDKPSAADIESIGYGIAGAVDEASARRVYDEKRFGLLVLDECGTWLNSRDWSEEGRRELVNVLLHIRKKLWHVYLIIQDISLLDKQARKALAEHVVYCRRLDRLNVPLLGFFYQRFTGRKLPLPQIHVAFVKYGDRPDSLTVERWFYRGGSLWAAYDTTQVFRADYPHGLFQVLPPWYRFAHARVHWSLGAIMRLTKIYFQKVSLVVLLASGMALGSGVAWWQAARSQEALQLEYESQLGTAVDQEGAALSDAEVGKEVKVPGRWWVAAEWSIEPGSWAAYFVRDGEEYHGDDLPSLGWSWSRVGECAYRLTSMQGAPVVARCRRNGVAAQRRPDAPPAPPGNDVIVEGVGR